MSIQNKIRIANRVDLMVSELKKKYPSDSTAAPELHKLSDALTKLIEYLSKLDELKPNYTTNEVDKYVVAINLNVDILKGELQEADFIKLQRGVKVLRTILRFHPTKYSFFEFVVIWFYELIYFI